VVFVPGNRQIVKAYLRGFLEQGFYTILPVNELLLLVVSLLQILTFKTIRRPICGRGDASKVIRSGGSSVTASQQSNGSTKSGGSGSASDNRV
jgi:hypothetical protein